jgi:hypothetical protein
LLFLHDDAVEAFKAFGPSLQHVVVICPHSRPLCAAPPPPPPTPMHQHNRTPNSMLFSALQVFTLQVRAAAARPNLPRAERARAGATVIALAPRHVRPAGAAMCRAPDAAVARIADDR